jgi:hypothetical protein
VLRTLRDGTPLRDLPPTRRKNLQEGEILLFFFFRPFQEKPGPVVTRWLRSFAPSSPFLKVSQTLKHLGLDLDPETVVANDYLLSELCAAAEDYVKDETVAAEVHLKAKTVAKEKAQNRVRVAAQSAHIEMNSVTNSVTNDLKGTGASAASDIHANGGSASSASLSGTTPTPATPETEVAEQSATEPDRMPDAEFSQKLIRVFTQANKDSPTRKQVRDVIASLIAHPWAPAQFLVALKSKIGRVKHPGVLPEAVDGFNNGWPQRLEILEATQPRAGEDPADREARLRRQYADSPKDNQATYREVYPDINFENRREKAMAVGEEDAELENYVNPFEEVEKRRRR